MKVNKELFEDYIQRNWKPNITRVQVVSGCNCASCQLHRQLTSEWDKNQAQAEEFQRHLRENKKQQAKDFAEYMYSHHRTARITPHPKTRQSFAAQNKKGL